MDGGGVTVEELDRALLELLEDCSEPAGVTVTEAEKAGLHEKQRVECGETWDQAAEVAIWSVLSEITIFLSDL